MDTFLNAAPDNQPNDDDLLDMVQATPEEQAALAALEDVDNGNAPGPVEGDGAAQAQPPAEPEAELTPDVDDAKQQPGAPNDVKAALRAMHEARQENAELRRIIAAFAEGKQPGQQQAAPQPELETDELLEALEQHWPGDPVIGMMAQRLKRVEANIQSQAVEVGRTHAQQVVGTVKEFMVANPELFAENSEDGQKFYEDMNDRLGGLDFIKLVNAAGAGQAMPPGFATTIKAKMDKALKSVKGTVSAQKRVAAANAKVNAMLNIPAQPPSAQKPATPKPAASTQDREAEEDRLFERLKRHGSQGR